MLRFVVRRFLQLVPILLGLSLLLFLWLRSLPGGPASALLGERATPERVAQVERLYGLDQPIWVQYLKFLGNAVRLDFGTSLSIPGYYNGQEVKVLDRGGAIKGNKLDVFFPNHERAKKWGRQKLDVTVLEEF